MSVVCASRRLQAAWARCRAATNFTTLVSPIELFSTLEARSRLRGWLPHARCSDTASESDLEFDDVALMNFDGEKYGDEYLSFEKGDIMCRAPPPPSEQAAG